MPEVTAESVQSLNVSSLAAVIRRDWGAKMNFAAKPYVAAMDTLDKITDNYIADSGTTIVAYFLGNAGSWRGPTAKIVKTELKRRMRVEGHRV